MTERALVTGASGFIGHHLVRALRERDTQVICLVRKTSHVDRLDRLGAELVYGDITDFNSLVEPISECAVVYHLAALTTALSLEQLLRVNEFGSRNVAQACAQAKDPPVLVMLSSLAAAGTSTDGTPLTESDEPRPISRYGRSKLAGEKVLTTYASRVPSTIIRAGIVFGEFDQDVYKMFWWIDKGIHLIPVNGQNRVSLIHATDCAVLMISAAESGERIPAQGDGGQGIYCGAYDHHPRYVELQDLIAAAMVRRRIIRIQFPRLLTLLAAGMLEGAARLTRRTPSIVNLDKAREGFAGSWTCSPEKAKRQLGFAPELSLQQRLRQTVNWYRQEGWL